VVSDVPFDFMNNYGYFVGVNIIGSTLSFGPNSSFGTVKEVQP
jgi:hypothetical protein